MFAALEDLKPLPTRVSRAPWDNLSAVERRFPRIARELCLLWGKGEIDAYLDSMLIDTRGDRQGFPSAVLEELMFLSSLRWQVNNPSFSRADEGLVEAFSFNPGPSLTRYSQPNSTWVLS